jgi:hypothetical protein
VTSNPYHAFTRMRRIADEASQRVGQLREPFS